ncbi:TlpA family protein disulfide reductase [Polaribacter porphyrae]|uniref:Redoxin n=1 Tax=Polaribacter porphyrae TaxID=1137780 RepID=A0A2S7WT68_9FLAO|nr:TlpA disulfide reductase family protein [Polaribacter porphyrae]PQJ80798.1 redoxin [Polaribacter porphyrae]
MRKIFLILSIFLLISCSDNPKQFSEEALKDMVLTIDDAKMTFREVLYKHKGEKILIDVWASWCKDCIVGFPELKELQKKFPKIKYVFLSVDRSNPSWKRAVKKYNLIGDQYNFPKGQNEGDFVDFISLGWIPRYLVVDEKGGIELFKATKVTDKDLLKALEKSK